MLGRSSGRTGMMSNKFTLSQFSRSHSLQSCFPEMKSENCSDGKSPEDNDVSISIERSNDDIYHKKSTSLKLKQLSNRRVTISKKFALSRFGRSRSLQSCFPEMKSAEGSGRKSPEDDDVSISIEQTFDDTTYKESNSPQKADDDISPASPSGNPSVASVPSEMNAPFLSISDTLKSRIPMLQIDSNASTVPQAGGSDTDVSLNQSMRQVGNGYSSMCQGTNCDAETHMEDSFTSFQLGTMPYSGVISGEIRGTGLKTYVVLYLAALKGDWEIAKQFLNVNPQAACARITRGSETALHIAAGARHTRFVEELVKLMRPEDLAVQNKVGNTALCFAAASGIRKIAEVMVNKNNKLPSIRGSKGALPIYMATLLGHKDMVWYLYSVTAGEGVTEEDRISLLIAAITANLFDVALDIIQQQPQLATARDGNGDTALHILARKPSAFLSGNQLRIWQRCLYSIPGFNVIYSKKLMHMQAVELVKRLWDQVLLLDDSKISEFIRTPSRLLFTAAELGIVEFVTLLIRSYPDLIWKVDDQSRSIFHVAVAHRQKKIFNLIYEIGALKDLIAAYKDENNVNMLHLAAKLAPLNRLKTDSGAALQLRREFYWFKEVEKIVQPLYAEMKDSEGRTPRMLFTEEHKGLVCEGEKWMKDTASSCMLVATLIATVMFAAAFTVPGGNNNDTGRPIAISERSFLVFAISDALALFSSATSILMFLSILTSRYAEEDFLDSLPNRLIIGLATLFISIATMMISFCATLSIVLDKSVPWVSVPMAVVACIPVTLFAFLQFPLLVDMVSHTYGSSIVFRPRNHLLY
ncbi:ankyrin repeat-containing protein NPR4-like isoform X1 [Actinidia eriantha]|uniref:ankyrin repeat-containing protein NPR4-like isoform X1 n=1 Tax=Actinidia eriantha TaxID=165200 RepID=UPI00258E82C5|nr:ankyrin repeat-containing protein NPR4-like isoform X1 [Actinidia eriantha]